MGIEIERKFLVKREEWLTQLQENQYESVPIKQGYINAEKERTVRVRTKEVKAYLTIKGESLSVTRQEFEYEIPFEDAVELLKLCNQPLIEKLRYTVNYQGTIWEVDVFSGENEGLFLAEVELQNENDRFSLPKWIDIEVSNDARYYNSALNVAPYKSWK
jgi:CYTH domain-containing protein